MHTHMRIRQTRPFIIIRQELIWIVFISPQKVRLRRNKHNQSIYGHFKLTTAHFHKCVLNVITRDNLLSDFIAFLNRIF